MKVLVTGGAGYFGSLLTQELKRRGHSCRVFDLNSLADDVDGVKVITGDIRNYREVLAACKGVDVIHHNVAQVPLAKDRYLFESVNYDGTRNVLRAALECTVGKVIYTSSSAVYGVPERNPVTEDTVPRPMEAYGKAKYKAELLCKEYVEKGLDVSIIRPRTIMGHGRLGIFQILFEWVSNGHNIPVLGSGENIYQFIHANDLAAVCISAGERAGPESYNCGASRFGSMRQVLEALCEHAGTGSRVKSVPMTPAVLLMKLTSILGLSPLGAYHSLMYGRSMYFDIDKARRHFGWEPKYSNEEMFIESYDWYIAHRHELLAERAGSPHRSKVNQRLLHLVKYVL